MKEENDIHDLLLSEERESFKKQYLKDKYIINDAETKPYYTWSSINDHQLDNLKMGISFSVLSEPIIHKSFQKIAGYGNIKKWSSKTGEHVREVEETGYVVPEFRFILIQLNKQKISEDDYTKALSKLDLENDSEIPFNTIHQISAYRDALLKQIIRQANIISDINQNIISVFKVYLYETKLAIGTSDISSDEKLKLLKKTYDTSSAIIHLIARGAPSKDVTEQYIPDLKKWNRYLPEKYWESTINGLNKYCKSRDKILETTAILAKQYLPYESLLEDVLLNNQIKTPEDFSEVNSQNDLSKYYNDEYWVIAHDYYHLGMSWKEVYNKVSEEMEEAGLERRHITFDSFKNGKQYYLKKNGR